MMRLASGVRYAGLLAVVAAGIASAGAAVVAPTARGDQRPGYTVVTTVGMIADVVRQVAGERAQVTNLIGEAVDPHLFRATRGDVATLLGADVIFYNGLMLEGRMGDTLVQVARRKPVYAVTELIDESFLLPLPGGAGHFDPHVWMDPTAWARAAQVVADALAEFDPSSAELYQANAAAYMERCHALHAWATQVLETIPPAQRVLVTAHDAFAYFGRAYGLEVRGIQGISTESEAGLDDINRLVDFIVSRRIPAVFVETSVADKNVRALVDGAAARGHAVIVGGTLYSDAMGPAGTYEGTYLGMLDHNITTIARALGGEAPAEGWQGLLGKRSDGTAAATRPTRTEDEVSTP